MSYFSLFPTIVSNTFYPEIVPELLPISKEYLDGYGEPLTDTYPNHISTYKNMDAVKRLIGDKRLMPFYNLIVNEAKKLLDYQNINCSRYTFHPEYLFNKIGKDSSHVKHTHPGALISGCFYLASSKDSAPITFCDPRGFDKYIHYDQIPGRNTPYPLDTEFWIKTPPGTLLMWPSWLEHYVPLNKSAGDRITLVFNLSE